MVKGEATVARCPGSASVQEGSEETISTLDCQGRPVCAETALRPPVPITLFIVMIPIASLMPSVLNLRLDSKETTYVGRIDGDFEPYASIADRAAYRDLIPVHWKSISWMVVVRASNRESEINRRVGGFLKFNDHFIRRGIEPCGRQEIDVHGRRKEGRVC